MKSRQVIERDGMVWPVSVRGNATASTYVVCAPSGTF